MKKLVIGCIRVYQFCISPWLGNQCRFYPTCSEYGRQSIERHGIAKGSWLTLVRLSKCHPWHEGGSDPVP